MRHRRRGRKLGRNPKHQRALLRNLASNLILTERDDDDLMFDTSINSNAPKPAKSKGRLITTVSKAKEVRPLVEKCISIARRALAAEDEASQYDTTADRNSPEWQQWREGKDWQQWNSSIAPALAARRHVLRLLGNKEAMRIIFDDLAPRFADRPGGYTRIKRLAQPRLGDAGMRAILEFVGVRDRVTQRSEKPDFESQEDEPGPEPQEESADGDIEDRS